MDHGRSRGAAAVSWMRYVLGSWSMLFTSSWQKWKAKLEAGLAHEVRPGRDEDETVRTAKSGSVGYDESDEEVVLVEAETMWADMVSALLDDGIETGIQEGEVPTQLCRGFVNEDGVLGVVLLFDTRAAVAAAVAPHVPISNHIIAFSMSVMEAISANISPYIVETCDADEVFEVFGHHVGIGDL